MTKLTDTNGVEIQVGQECEAYNNETGTYFNGEVLRIKDEFVSVEDIDEDVFDIEPDFIEVKLDLREIAEQEGFNIIETTTGTNGYPQNLKFAIVGFENFEDAQHLAYKYGLNVESFRKKDGWGLWNRDNANMYAPYKISANDFGDNYCDFEKMDEEDFMEIEVDPVLKDTQFEDMEALESFVTAKRELWEEIDEMEDDEVVIGLYGGYFDTFKKEPMSFSHDTWNYTIGII